MVCEVSASSRAFPRTARYREDGVCALCRQFTRELDPSLTIDIQIDAAENLRFRYVRAVSDIAAKPIPTRRHASREHKKISCGWACGRIVDRNYRSINLVQVNDSRHSGDASCCD